MCLGWTDAVSIDVAAAVLCCGRWRDERATTMDVGEECETGAVNVKMGWSLELAGDEWRRRRPTARAAHDVVALIG